MLVGSSSAAALAGGFGAKPTQKAKSFDGRKTFQRQMKAFNKLQAGPDTCCLADVYVRSADSDKFWFVGKTTTRAEACEDAAAFSTVVQKRLVLEHGKLLQRELKSAKTLQMWIAPGGTEMKVAQKQQALRNLDGLKAKSVDLEMASCGFMPEQYEKANGEVEKGFYVRLPDDGVPLEPEEFGGENSRVRVVTPDEAAAMGMLGGDGPPS